MKANIYLCKILIYSCINFRRNPDLHYKPQKDVLHRDTLNYIIVAMDKPETININANIKLTRQYSLYPSDIFP